MEAWILMKYYNKISMFCNSISLFLMFPFMFYQQFMITSNSILLQPLLFSLVYFDKCWSFFLVNDVVILMTF